MTRLMVLVMKTSLMMIPRLVINLICLFQKFINKMGIGNPNNLMYTMVLVEITGDHGMEVNQVITALEVECILEDGDD